MWWNKAHIQTYTEIMFSQDLLLMMILRFNCRLCIYSLAMYFAEASYMKSIRWCACLKTFFTFPSTNIRFMMRTDEKTCRHGASIWHQIYIGTYGSFYSNVSNSNLMQRIFLRKSKDATFRIYSGIRRQTCADVYRGENGRVLFQQPLLYRTGFSKHHIAFSLCICFGLLRRL